MPSARSASSSTKLKTTYSQVKKKSMAPRATARAMRPALVAEAERARKQRQAGERGANVRARPRREHTPGAIGEVVEREAAADVVLLQRRSGALPVLIPREHRPTS